VRGFNSCITVRMSFFLQFSSVKAAFVNVLVAITISIIIIVAIVVVVVFVVVNVVIVVVFDFVVTAIIFTS